MGAPVVVDQVDEGWLLTLAEHAELESRRAERSKLRYAYQWCVLHPARTANDAATWGDLGGRERECDLALGGDGAPLVAAFAAEPFAAALGVPTRAGMRLMGDALDLVHRLPRHWAKVEALEIAPWRARRVAEATAMLSREAAAHVDAELAPVIDSCGPTRIDRVVEQARARFDAAELADAEEAEAADWDVRLIHGPSGRFAGTSRVEITGDTPTLSRFHDLLSRRAHEAIDPQDPAGPTVRQRKIAALGALTDGALGATEHIDALPTTRSKLYLHLDGQTLLDPTV